MIKDPDANLDYTVDWSKWLDIGETITTSTWLIPDGLTQAGGTHTDTTATVWLTGGTTTSRYMVTNRITTSAGRTDDRSFALDVRDR